MALLQALIRNKAWVAHLLALLGLTGTELTQGQNDPYLLAAVTFLTSVFHVCDTLKTVKTTSVRVDMTPPGPPLTNASGDSPITS